MTSSEAEIRRLEGVWGGEFGDEYVDRNLESYGLRKPFWDGLLPRLAPQRLLEVGCNAGGNLRHIAPHVGERAVYGIDINRKALRTAQQLLPTANLSLEAASELPFRDGWFDLVFTMGVLIHQPEESVRTVMSEMVRCSSRYVLTGEYFDDGTVEVPYRGIEGALFRRDYGALFLEVAPELTLADTGRLTAEQGFDDVTWWLFEKQ
jgi:pseudaminic acid biosynthesis-associated methylase